MAAGGQSDDNRMAATMNAMTASVNAAEAPTRSWWVFTSRISRTTLTTISDSGLNSAQATRQRIAITGQRSSQAAP